MIGQTIAHYKILEKIGEGGMGQVYLAEDVELRRKIALKFLPSGYSSDADVLARFKREAQAAAALNHPNIITVHEVGTHDGRPFIVMAYADGESLRDVIAKKEFPLENIVEIAIQVCDALVCAHEAGVVHRDIKPANIVVGNDGRAKLLDFGLAKLRGVSKLTMEDTTLGTVSYMSPEQTRGEDVDHRSDVFSFGAVLYEWITGQLPFQGKHTAAVMYAITAVDPQPLQRYNRDASPELERIVFKALAKNPADRYQAMGDMLVDLRAYARSMQGGTGVGPPGRTPRRHLRWALPIGAATIIAVALVVIVGRSDRSPIESEVDHSIAVLPFENLSRDPAEDYFVDGMTEALIADLAKIKSLRVISRTSVMRYKETDKSLPDIARELNVHTILEGGVLRVGDRVRITTQLIEAQTDRHLWAESYERDLRDILTLQGELARAIADTIKVRLTPEEEASLAGARTIDPEAHSAYLHGRYYWNKRTEADLRRSIAYFEQAIEREPDYALALAGLADAYSVIGGWGFLSPKEAVAKAKGYATRALEIDPSLAQAYATLAGHAWDHWDWARAESLFVKTIALNPDYATGHQWYAEFLCEMGRHDEALSEIQRALDLDPLSLVINASMGALLHYARRYDEAIARCEKTLEIGKDFSLAHHYLWQSYNAKGMYRNAVEHLEKGFRGVEDGVERGVLTGIYETSGIEGVYRWIVGRGENLTNQTYNNPYYLAMAHALLGEVDEALSWLDEAYRVHSRMFAYLKVDPALDSLRADARFDELLAKAGLE